MRISDWSSDVCSSDLCDDLLEHARGIGRKHAFGGKRFHPLYHHGPDHFDRRCLADGVAGYASPRKSERDREFLRFGRICAAQKKGNGKRSEEHTSEFQSLMSNSYAVFCLKKKTTI